MKNKITVTAKGFLEGIRKLFQINNIISLSGESGTGKSTIALFLVGNSLRNGDQCIWVQASENFSIIRMSQIFEEDPNQLGYLKNNIFITPKDHVIQSYQEQSKILLNIVSGRTILPPGLKFLVIDNISHHLRYRITQSNNISQISNVLDEFYEKYLMPLILFCKRNKIVLILIHEMTFVPKISQTRPFFCKLYDRVKTIDFVLGHTVNSAKKTIEIFTGGTKWKFAYDLEQTGIALH